MAMVYQWKQDRSFPIAAQVAGERLNLIKAKAGEITPRNVVADAQAHNSPLHRCFEWDDAKAADEHRLQQARHLIGAIVVVQVNDKPVKQETRAFVHLANGGPRYEPVQVAMRVPDQRAEILATARAEIERWRQRYAALLELSDLFVAVDGFLAETAAPNPGTAGLGVAAE